MKYIFALLIALITSSCFFGPVKELKYQIEDSFDEGESLSEPIVYVTSIIFIISFFIIYFKNKNNNNSQTTQKTKNSQ